MESIIEEIKNAFKKPNNGNIQLIIINLAVFLLAQTFYIIGTLAKQQLIVLQDFLRDEFGRDLTDDQFVDAIEKSSFYREGLIYLTPLMINQLK